MSFITSRKGSLLLAALLVLILLVYLLFHLLAPRVVQSTDDAYVHADFTLVAPKVAGFVQDVLVEDNQPVKAGQLLARLDDRDFRTALAAAEADVLGAEANLANAEANLQRQQALIEQARAKVRAEQAELVFARHEQSRYQTLASKGAGSLQNAQQAQSRIDTASARLAEGQAAVDATRKQVSVLEARVGQARGDLQRMQARRDQARLDLSYCELRAPFDGLVGRRQLRVGAYVTASMCALLPPVANGSTTLCSRARSGNRSRRTFSAPENEALYTGVATSRPSARPICSASASTGGLSRRARSRSSAGKSSTWWLATSTPRRLSQSLARSSNTPERERTLGLPAMETTSMGGFLITGKQDIRFAC